MRFTAETRGCLKCKISSRLTRKGGRTYGRTLYGRFSQNQNFWDEWNTISYPWCSVERASCARELRYYFAQGVLGHFPLPNSISVQASCSWFLFYVEVFTFRDLTATFTCQQGEFAPFYDNTFMFCVSDAWVKIESHMKVWLLRTSALRSTFSKR